MVAAQFATKIGLLEWLPKCSKCQSGHPVSLQVPQKFLSKFPSKTLSKTPPRPPPIPSKTPSKTPPGSPSRPKRDPSKIPPKPPPRPLLRPPLRLPPLLGRLKTYFTFFLLYNYFRYNVWIYAAFINAFPNKCYGQAGKGNEDGKLLYSLIALIIFCFRYPKMRRGPPLFLPALRGVFKYHRLHNEYKTHCTTLTLSTVSS